MTEQQRQELEVGRKAVELLRSLLPASFYIGAIELHSVEVDGDAFGLEAEAIVDAYDAIDRSVALP